MENFKVKVNPSILSGDFGRLAEEAKRMEQAGADAIHIDIMDGHFVPNLTLGPRAVGAINSSTSLFLDVHLMIYNPFDYIEMFIHEGADRLTFHFEATEDVEDTLSFIRQVRQKSGACIPARNFFFDDPEIPVPVRYGSPHDGKPGIRRAEIHAGSDRKDPSHPRILRPECDSGRRHRRQRGAKA